MRTLITLTLLAVLAPAPESRAAGSGAVAIVVNKGNAVEALTAKQLQQIFSGEKARWADGQKIQTLATSAADPGHKVAIQFLIGMSEPEYQKYCIHANFVGNAQQVPRESGSSEAVLNLVKLIPGAIAFVRTDAVNPAVKVVKVDGMTPADPGYPLAAK